MLLCVRTLNYDVKPLLHSRITYRFFDGFDGGIFFERLRIARPTLLYLGYALGPGSLSLPVFVWCPQLLQNWRYNGSAIDHS